MEPLDSKRLDMRPESLSPLTLDEHRELGRELKLAGSRLRELELLITRVYGANSRASFSFVKAAESMERLQMELDAQAQADFPGLVTDGLYL
jgi:hypothetical protein